MLARGKPKNVRLCADRERIEDELHEHHRAANAAARNAGVEQVLIAAAEPSDPDTLLALDAATETRRREIRACARAAGVDEDVIDDIPRMAEPNEPELGWTAVVGSTEEYVRQVERAREVGLPVDVDAIFAEARRRGTSPVPYLVRVNDLWAKAFRAGLNKEHLTDFYTRGEERQAGTGWSAIEDAKAKRVERQEDAERAARVVGVDVQRVRACGVPASAGTEQGGAGGR